MTKEEFIKNVLGDEVSNYSQEEIEAFYIASIGLFNCFFDRWKKEKIKLIKL